ncbi:MAG: hypothetical protein IKL01_05780 [Mailhella sp.]|nr:hypothetical protein [Mailhella sp.]
MGKHGDHAVQDITRDLFDCGKAFFQGVPGIFSQLSRLLRMLFTHAFFSGHILFKFPRRFIGRNRGFSFEFLSHAVQTGNKLAKLSRSEPFVLVLLKGRFHLFFEEFGRQKLFQGQKS